MSTHHPTYCISWLTVTFSIGKLRLQLPQPIAHYSGTVKATAFGNQCIQQTINLPTVPNNFPPQVEAFIQPMAAVPDVSQSEDCT